MGGVEGLAEEAVAAAVSLVELVPWMLVVAVVGEAAEVEVELVGPVAVGERGVEDDERVAAVAGAGGDTETAAVATGEQPGDRVVAEGTGCSALVGCVDVKVGVGELAEGIRRPAVDACSSASWRL